MAENWKTIAKNDPKIKAWYEELRKNYPNEPKNIINHMEGSIKNFDNGKGFGYDYKTAIESGLRPEFVKETNNYRWVSDTKDGKWLKGEKHPTRNMIGKKEFNFEIKRPEPKKRNFDLTVPITVRERERNLIDDFLDDTIYKNYRDDDILRSDNPTEALDGYKQIESKVKNEDPKVANVIKKQFIQEKENQYSIVSGEPERETIREFAGPSVGYIEKQVEKPKVQGLTDEEVNVLVELEELRPEFAEIYEEKLKTAQPETTKELYDPISGDFYDVPSTESLEDLAYKQAVDQMVSEGKMGSKASNLMAEFFNSAIPIGKLTPKEQAELMIQATPGERFIAGGSGMLAGYGMVGKIGRSADTYRKVTRGLDRYLSGVRYGKDSFKVATKLDPVKGKAIAEMVGRGSASAQTFGTYTLADMLDENIPTSEKAYEVLNSVMLGTGLGATGTIASPFKRIPAEGLVGFTSGLLDTGDPKEATLNALIFMGFGLLNRQNLKQDERTVLWERLGDDFITYFRQSLRNPNLTKEQRVEAKKIILKELRKIKANATPDELRNEIESIKKQILYGVQKMTATKQTEKAIKKQIAGEMTRESMRVAKKVKESVKVTETGKGEKLSKDNMLKMTLDQQVPQLKELGYTDDQLVRIGGEDRANIIANAIKPVNYYGKEQPKPKIEIKRPEKPVKIEEKPEPVEVKTEPVIELPKKIKKPVKPKEKPVQVSEELPTLIKRLDSPDKYDRGDVIDAIENIVDKFGADTKGLLKSIGYPTNPKSEYIDQDGKIVLFKDISEKASIVRGKKETESNIDTLWFEAFKPKPPKTKKPVESNLVELDPKQVKVDESKFQPREEYNQAVIDDIAKNFDATKWDPPVLWQDPKSKDYFVVSGHHRQKGVIKGGVNDAMYKVLPEGTTLAQAKNFAGASNLQATGQSEFETAAEIRRRIEEGDSYEDVASDMPGLFKNVKNKTDKLKKIQKLAYLDPKGKFKEHFDNAEFPKIVSKARQIAQLRKSYDWFTDKHEDDVFKYLYVD